MDFFTSTARTQWPPSFSARLLGVLIYPLSRVEAPIPRRAGRTRAMSASALTSGAFTRPLLQRGGVVRRHALRSVGIGGGHAPSRARRSSVTCSSAEDRFAHVRPGEPDGRNRADISVGAEVDIVLKADQGTGRLTRGVVREFLTNSKHHPQGIKVRLVDGAIGRVERVVSGGGGGGARAAETASGRPRGSATSATSSTNRTNRTCDASSSSSSSSSSSREPNGDRDDAETTRGAPSTVYLSNIPKALSKADVRWLVEEISGVTGLRLPKRGGKNMGYAFITCDGEASANAAIAAVHGMELEGKSLVAERARTETRSGAEDDGRGPSRSDGRGEPKPKAAADGNGNKRKRRRGKLWKREEEEEEEEEAEDAADPIAAARAEMEAEAILELERAKRAAKRQMEAAEAIAAERRAKEAAAEARTTAMLAERRRRAEAAASAAAAKRDREETARREAVALGPVVVDPRWETELLELTEVLAELRASVE